MTAGLYDRVREAWRACQHCDAGPGEPLADYSGPMLVELLADLQTLLERQARQADDPVQLWCCTLFLQAEGTNADDDARAPACWVGTWKPDECPNCGMATLIEPVTRELHASDRAAVWLAICDGALAVLPFGADP